MKAIKQFSKTLLFSALLASSSFATATPIFNINLNFTGGLTSSQQSTITQAVSYWRDLITGYQPGVSNEFSGLNIDIGALNIDGYSGTLAQAATYSTYSDITGGYTLSTGGIIEFDIHDIASSSTTHLFDTAFHEIGHVLGIGSLWEENGLYIANSGAYTGSNGLAAYQKEFDPTATFIPVELAGGSGTANSHWDESEYWYTTGITNKYGKDMQDEIMTGSKGGNEFLSDTTIASLSDLGYTVSAVPVPAAVWLFSSALGMLVMQTKRRG